VKAKKLTKGKAFWAAFWSLNALYLLTALVAKDSLNTIGPIIVGAIAAAGGIFQAANVADNLVKGKHYVPDLDKEEGK
jgi:hypothetical protein